MKPRFEGSTAVIPVGVRNGRTLWRVEHGFTYHSAVHAAPIVVPKDFVFDGATVPRLPVVFWLAGGYAIEAAAVHDWLHQSGVIKARKIADRVFYEIMAVRRDPPEAWRRWLMWAGVRAFGWTSWRHAEERKEALNPDLPKPKPDWLKGAEYGTPPRFGD